MSRKRIAQIIPLSEASIHNLRQLKQLNPLDFHLANFLMAEAQKPHQALALATALTSHATREGHICLELQAFAGKTLVNNPQCRIDAPEIASWRKTLLESGVVAEPGAWQPLILDKHNRLYLHRYWTYELQLGQALIQRAHRMAQDIDLQCLREGLEQLFQTQERRVTDWQKSAAATAVLRNLTVISGGPGTGKTTTVVRILALLRQQPGGDALRIALAAPTGMAAARLQQSIGLTKSHLPLPDDLCEKLPESATTLHRLLGVERVGTGFRYHREHPLPFDVVILDEASMVDVALMAKLMQAMPEKARLILLGDHHQLASVEAGAVLGDICSGCGIPEPHFAEKLNLVTQQPIESTSAPGNCLRNSVILLRKNYRFSETSPIGRLAQAVKTGDVAEACRLLHTEDRDERLQWQASVRQTTILAASHFAELFAKIAAGASVVALFKKLYAFRVLCVLREGPFGVNRLNLAITRRLKEQGDIPDNRIWYSGRPVMLTRNDYQLNLYNGETGIVLPHPDQPGELAVAFVGAHDTIRWIAPARLAYCETVYALTVHKSQGSEYQHVLLQLPDYDNPVLCRELLYTAITRAKKRFTLVGAETIFRSTLARRMKRASGLAQQLCHNPG
jgi:exodeoxyribonuclease V alpha subunit